MKRSLSFLDHDRSLGENRYVYAVVSRRARGVSLGVNLNPDKACNFACPYCQVDRTTPGGERTIALDVLGAELDALLTLATGEALWETPPFETVDPTLRRVADVAFAGDGEPTTAPELADAARLAREVLHRHRLDVPLRLFTNATLLHKARVRAALGYFDELWCKLDAGTEAYFQLVDGTHLPLQCVLDNLRDVGRERPLVLQSLFLTLSGEGPSEAETDAYSERLGTLLREGATLDRVLLYTVARKPADPRVGPLSAAALERIAAKVRALGLTVEVAV